MSLTQAAIEMRDVRKEYRAWRQPTFAAVDGAEWVVSEGEGVALVGPNGAGKSTLLLLAAGMRRPTSGTVRVFGQDPTVPRARVGVGLLPDRPALPAELTVIELLQLVAHAHGLPDPEAHIAQTMDRMELGAAHGAIGNLSAGLYQRAALAVSLLPSPRLLLLDEPLGALDPTSVSLVRDALAEERARGTTVVVATHRLADMTGCCDRVVHVMQGTTERLGAIDHVLVRMPVRVAYSLPPGAQQPLVGSPQPAPPGVFIRHAASTSRDALVEDIRVAGGTVIAVDPLCDRLTAGLPLEAEETLA